MYVRGEVHGKVEDLDNTIMGMQNLAIALESYTDVSCLHAAIDYLFDILGADIEE